MKTPPKNRFVPISNQRGVVLFFALMALLAMSLAAVALIRSVDTNTMIAGNLAFKQASAASADAGVEQAINWLDTTEKTNNTLNVLMDISHPLNANNAAAGYYSSLNPALNLTDGTGIVWDNTDSVLVGTDASGNTVRYIIQRMCRTANQLPRINDCLFSGAIQDNNQQNILLPQEVCVGEGCPVAGQSPQYRVTSRSEGPRKSVSYIQAFVY